MLVLAGDGERLEVELLELLESLRIEIEAWEPVLEAASMAEV